MKFATKTSCAFLYMLIGIFGIQAFCHAQMSSDKTSFEKVKQETQDLLETLKAYSADQRDEAIEKTKAALANLDRRIEVLEKWVDKNWDKMNKTARENARSNLKALRKQRIKVAEWYGSLKSSSADAWEHVKKGFSDAYASLNQAWEKSENEFVSNK